MKYEAIVQCTVVQSCIESSLSHYQQVSIEQRRATLKRMSTKIEWMNCNKIRYYINAAPNLFFCYIIIIVKWAFIANCFWIVKLEILKSDEDGERAHAKERERESDRVKKQHRETWKIIRVFLNVAFCNQFTSIPLKVVQWLWHWGFNQLQNELAEWKSNLNTILLHRIDFKAATFLLLPRLWPFYFTEPVVSCMAQHCPMFEYLTWL